MLKAFKKNHPEIAFALPVLYTSRSPRPIESDGVDYHFRSEEYIRVLPAQRFVVGPVRYLWQAVDMEEMNRLVQINDLIIMDIHPSLAEKFRQHPIMQGAARTCRIESVFVSPLTAEEIPAVQQGMGFSTPQEAVAAVMLPKLISRSLQQGKLITPTEMDDLRIRASEAFNEMQSQDSYDHVLINHDGEDSNNWKTIPPIGEAGKLLRDFVAILRES